MTSIIVVEDHPALAQSLAIALESRGIAEVHVYTPDDPRTQDAVTDRDHELALLDLDLGMNRGAGVEYLRRAVAAGQRAAMFTGSTDKAALGHCLAEGAIDVVRKSLSFDEVVRSIECLLAGYPATDGTSRMEWLLAYQHRADRLAPFERLTKREKAVLNHLIDGHRVDRIAELDYVSVATVRSQVQSVLTKLGASSQIQAVALAAKHGWIKQPAA